MQQKERPPMPKNSPQVETALSGWDAEMAKEKVENKIGTKIADLVRDIATANQMAKDKFDGDTALMHTARGSVSALIGVGLESVMDSAWKTGIKNGQVWAGRIPLQIGEQTRAQLKELATKHVRWNYFVENTGKDLLTGFAYNAIAYFSGRMLPQAEAQHLLWSVGLNALEARGTKGLDSYVNREATIDAQRDLEKEKILRETRLAETKAAVAAAQGRSKELITRVQTDELAAQGNLDAVNNKIANLTIPEADVLKWQTTIRKYLKHSNPATILGVDWLLDGLVTLFKNVGKVRKVRKERGGLPGQKVEMPASNDRWQNRDRREQGDKKQNKVYYGRSQWNATKETNDDLGKAF